MDEVAIKQLRDSLASYLRRVREGQALLITDRGTPVARLSPVDGSLASLEAEGLVVWSRGKPHGSSHPPVARGGTVADLVAEQRR